MANRKIPAIKRHATILRTDAPGVFLKGGSSSWYTVHIYAVYGGGNSLRFRCPACGEVHGHGAGEKGGDSDGITPTPHCCSCQHCGLKHPYAVGIRGSGRTGWDKPGCFCFPPVQFLGGAQFQWCLYELTEGMDISLAGDLSYIKGICPRRHGGAGYDQLLNGGINYSASPAKLIAAYKRRGGGV